MSEVFQGRKAGHILEPCAPVFYVLLGRDEAGDGAGHSKQIVKRLRKNSELA